VNLITAPSRASRTVSTVRARQAGWPAGARSWFVAVVSLVLTANVLASRYLLADSVYDLYAGRYIAHHGIPHRNVFTAAARAVPWIDQQWLAHVAYYGTWAAGGYGAVAVLSALLLTSGFAVLALLMLRRGVPPPRMFAWTTAALMVCLGETWIRAQSFAFPCFALTLWLILEDDRAPRLRPRTWLVVPVLVLWANTHGSVLLGAGLVVLYAVYRVTKSAVRHDPSLSPGYLALGAVAGVSVFCTPYGTGLSRYYRLFIGNPDLPRYAGEWVAPSLSDPLSWAFFTFLLATVIAVGVAVRRSARPDPLLLGLAAVLLGLAVTGVRFQAWFAFGGSMVAADTLARGGGRVPALGGAFRRTAARVLAALALISVGALVARPDRQFESGFPVQPINVAAALAADNPALRILGDDWCGTPMLWLHPAMLGRVGFDIRVEQYPGAELSAYFDFMQARRGWQRAMKGYSLILVSRRHHALLASALERLPGWRVVYEDAAGLVLERQAFR
jgi:hypothetical protein